MQVAQCAGPFGGRTVAGSDRIWRSLVRWLPTVVVLLALLLVAPLWPWSRGWGWTPAGMVGVTLVTILLFTLSFEPV